MYVRYLLCANKSTLVSLALYLCVVSVVLAHLRIAHCYKTINARIVQSALVFAAYLCCSFIIIIV